MSKGGSEEDNIIGAFGDIADEPGTDLPWDARKFLALVMTEKATIAPALRTLPNESLAAIEERLEIIRKLLKSFLPNRDRRRGEVLDHLRCVRHDGGPHVYQPTPDGWLVCDCGYSGHVQVLKDREDKQLRIEEGREKAQKLDKKQR